MAFNLVLQPINPDGDCLFASILTQLDKVYHSTADETIKQRLKDLCLVDGSLSSKILQLR